MYRSEFYLCMVDLNAINSYYYKDVMQGIKTLACINIITNRICDKQQLLVMDIGHVSITRQDVDYLDVSNKYTVSFVFSLHNEIFNML